MPNADSWRDEADDEWLAEHSSRTFARLTVIFNPAGGAADAVSYSPIAGILGGSQRNPDLRVQGPMAGQIRYAEMQYAYTTVTVALDRCRTCGYLLAERHRLLLVGSDGSRTQTGSVRKCRRCDADSWMFRSWMPSVLRRERLLDKIVL